MERWVRFGWVAFGPANLPGRLWGRPVGGDYQSLGHTHPRTDPWNESKLHRVQVSSDQSTPMAEGKFFLLPWLIYTSWHFCFCLLLAILFKCVFPFAPFLESCSYFTILSGMGYVEILWRKALFQLCYTYISCCFWGSWWKLGKVLVLLEYFASYLFPS